MPNNNSNNRTQAERLTAVEVKIDTALDNQKDMTDHLKSQDVKLDALSKNIAYNAEVASNTAQLAAITANAVSESAKQNAETTARLTRLDLNGHTANLKKLADATPDLLAISQVAPALQNLSQEYIQRQLAKQQISKWLHLKTISKLIYAAVGGGVLVFAIEIILHLGPGVK